ncbi:MAG: HU family DNA-binding protein [Campylobacterota bacterium]|nr:HU family DNA-binding protein [Campylobacterota bacterium]
MNKSELIKEVAQKAALTQKDTTAALEATLETITEALVKGEDVQFIGFGTFSTSKRAAREGVNPSTGAKIQIAESTVAKFKVGAKLKNSIRDGK